LVATAWLPTLSAKLILISLATTIIPGAQQWYSLSHYCYPKSAIFEPGRIFIVFTHPGQSLITGPDGAVVRNNKDESETCTVTEIDLSEALADRSGHIVDRRPEVYKL